MVVRGKFAVTSHQIHKYGPADNQSYTRVILEPRYDESVPEDARYAKATPSGKIEMQVDNPTALEQFTINKQFYVDFTPVE